MFVRGKARERIFHLFSVICPIGVNTGQREQESEQEGPAAAGLVLCLDISSPT